MMDIDYSSEMPKGVENLNTMPNLSDIVSFHSGQVRNLYF